MKSNLGKKIAKAVLPLGLPESSLGAFIGDLAGDETALLPKIPGITPEIIEAGFRAYKQTFLDGFRLLWITAAAFSAVGLIGKCFRSLRMNYRFQEGANCNK